jgi:hypothetical protein
LTKTLVDLTKPLELNDGTPVTLSHTYDNCFQVEVPTSHPLYRASGYTHQYRQVRMDGTRVPGLGATQWSVRNVVAAALDTTKQLQTVDGKAVSYIGKLEDGRIVVAISYATWSGQPATELRFADGRKSSRPGETSGDDVIVKVVRKEQFRNVYADGTMGESIHTTEEAAKLRSKYGKVRVGVLHQTLENGKLVRATMTAASPWFRSRGFPSGRAAVAADY